MRAITTETAPAPVAGAPYRQAVAAEVAGGELLFVSGQLPIDPAAGGLVADEPDVQTRQAIRNVIAIVEAAGGGVADIAKTTIYVTDLADFGTVNAAYADELGGHAPARATVQVSALPLGARIEVEAVAVLSRA